MALKGLGGFHLVCDARREDAVERLRARKRRDGKPFAVMVANVASARRLAAIDDLSAQLLAGRERPIVIVPARDDARLARGISNGLPTVGLFLPYTPLHWLVIWDLLGRPAGLDWMSAASDLALVATSANVAGEPIVIDGADARSRLAGIADAVADHDRAIVTRADDSVVRCVAGAPAFVRRARGFTPMPIRLAREFPCVAALGAQLKATVTVTRGREAFVSQHVGDLDTPDAVAFLEETLQHMLSILEVEPVAIACDLHPDFPTSRLAQRLGPPVIAVQHHHAHVAALAAEHHVEGPLLGLSLDGFGLGSDGGAWGGELLCVDGEHFERLGHLAPLPAPGGDRAAREPWRMAAAALHALGHGHMIERRFADEPLARQVRTMLTLGLACEPTTSAGRLFDAAAGLLGVSRRQAFEGEAAMRLEALASGTAVLAGGWRIDGGVLDFLPLLGRLADGMAPAAGAALFHGTLIAALVEWTAAAALARGFACGGAQRRLLPQQGAQRRPGRGARGERNSAAGRPRRAAQRRRLVAGPGLHRRVGAFERPGRNGIMCHALPVKIVALTGPDTAKVSLGGIIKEISIALIDDPRPGDYVVLHVGYALAKIDEAEAERTLALLAAEGSDALAEFSAAAAATAAPP